MNATRRKGLAKAAANLLASQPILPTQPDGDGTWVTRTSPDDVNTTAKRLAAAIEKAGGSALTIMDHAAQGLFGGLCASPVALVPVESRSGTRRATSAAPLPVRMVVWNEEGRTRIGALGSEEISEHTPGAGMAERLSYVEKTLNRFLDSAFS